MGTCIQKISDVVTSNQMRVNFLAIQFGWARWRHEVVRVVMCCETRGRRGKLPGLWYYFCTETIGRKGVLLRPLVMCPEGWKRLLHCKMGQRGSDPSATEKPVQAGKAY